MGAGRGGGSWGGMRGLGSGGERWSGARPRDPRAVVRSDSMTPMDKKDKICAGRLVLVLFELDEIIAFSVFSIAFSVVFS